MKISQTGSGTPASRGRKAERAGSTAGADAFKGYVRDDPAASASGPSAAPALAALSSLLAIQEAPDAIAGRRRAVLHGDALLDELKQLQLSLVEGWVPEETLRGLASLLRGPRPAIDDAELNGVLDEIEVRAAVELAKLERSRG